MNCVMRYDRATLDTSLTSKPLQRRAIRIPCPRSSCDPTLRCSWICANCQSPVEYGYVDDRVYCDCGATPFDRWSFKCNGPRHRSAWSSYDRHLLHSRLKNLEPFEDLNILILGETGVGKSTWINAFVNYLTFDTLDDAIQLGGLKCLIPCSFSAQVKHPTDPGGRLVQKDIKIGKNQYEHDGGRGQSDTMCTSVYSVTIGNTRLRLIDTPGIGNTKGLDQDNRNMADIVRVLRTYDELHGVLILLKPNGARLTVMFRFCMKQLLALLHRDAADNIVFGFTSTRGSNYTPGDTFKPLQALLMEYREVKLGLFERNVYCFDSEGFRYLAARRKGLDMGNLEDNMRSWEHSVSESKQLLKHIRGLTPHQVRSTINLNETRDMLVKLTETMTLIAHKTENTIAVNNDLMKKLHNTKLSQAQLKKSLSIRFETVESYEVDPPRTICRHRDCVEVQKGLAIYKACHQPCGLSASVKRNKNMKAHINLRACSAMDKRGFCRECGHSYTHHMHVWYDYRTLVSTRENKDVSRELMKLASDMGRQQQAIRLNKTAIAELRLEHTKIQEAAIQFSFFLKRHAIEPYNDATIDYFKHLINQEKLKPKNGGTKDMLEKYKAAHEHLQTLKALTKTKTKPTMKRSNTDMDITLDDQGQSLRQLIHTLYSLPHFGEHLKQIARAVNNERAAAEATYNRERSCNIHVSAGKHWIRDMEEQVTRSKKEEEGVRVRSDKRHGHSGSCLLSENVNEPLLPRSGNVDFARGQGQDAQHEPLDDGDDDGWFSDDSWVSDDGWFSAVRRKFQDIIILGLGDWQEPLLPIGI